MNSGRRVANRRLSQPGIMLRRHTGVAERIKVRAREMSLPTGNAAAAARAVAYRLPIVKIALVVCFVLFVSIGLAAGINAFAKSRELSVRIENGIAPMPVDVVTTALTVKDLLAQNNIRLGPNDEVTPALNTRLTEGMAVLINRAMIVFISSKDQVTHDDKLQQLYLTGGTVKDALQAADISYDQDDEITPSLDTLLSAGMTINYVNVNAVVIDEYQSVDYNTKTMNDPSLPKGTTKVMQPGAYGVIDKKIQVISQDGVEISRTELSNMSIVEKPPVPRIIDVGTGTAPKTSTSSDSGSGGGIAGIYSDLYKDVDPSVDCVIPPIPSQFVTTLYMTITAYEPTGRTTACGNWPQFTRTLKKPGTIAVNPNAIPYGTLLYVTGYGYCVAEDTGSNKGDSSRMGDVFMATHQQCINWGRRRNVTVYVVQYNFKTKWTKG